MGQGKFSDVYAARRIHDNQSMVIKVFKNSKSKKIVREVMVLKHLQESPYVVKYYDALKDATVGLIFFIHFF